MKKSNPVWEINEVSVKKSNEKQNAERRLGKKIVDRLFRQKISNSLWEINEVYNLSALCVDHELDEDKAMNLKFFDLQVAYNILLKHRDWKIINEIFYKMVYLQGMGRDECEYTDPFLSFEGGPERIVYLREVLRKYPSNQTKSQIEEMCKENHLMIEELYYNGLVNASEENN